MTRSRRTRLLGAALLLAGTVGCTGVSGAQEAPTEGAPGESTTTSSTAAPTTTRAIPTPLADQTAPTSTLGLDFHDGLLWVADFRAGEILAVDPDSWSIVRRLTSEENVSDEVTTVVVADDGAVYWTGLNDGAVGVLRGNAATTLGSVPPGTCSLALGPDGRTLFAGGAVAGTAPVWRLDTRKERPEEPSAAKVRLRSFTVGRNGVIYGPRFGPAAAAATAAQPAGALVQVDAQTGAELPLAAVDSPIAVALSPDEATAYVLSLAAGRPPALTAVDLATGAIRDLPAPRTPLVDSITVAPDGRIFVSAFNEPVISVVNPVSGNVKTINIGVRTPAEERPR